MQEKLLKPNQIKSSIYKGVRFCQTKKKWLARIYPHGKSKFLGSFDNEIDAAKAYNESALYYFGENAVLNDV